MTAAASPLRGCRVVVTRPAAEAGPLVAAIREAGGEALLFPAIEVGPAPDPASVNATLAQLATFDLVVFISPTAVSASFERIGAAGGWPAHGPAAAAVGPGTARALAERGVREVILPESRFDSEGLLAHPRLADVRGRRILIIRGEGGRETLARTLVARGASVTYAECYRRGPPTWDPAPLVARLRAGTIDAIVALSAEAAAQLAAHVAGWTGANAAGAAPGHGVGADAGQDVGALLHATRLVVPHPRVGEAATRAGWRRVVVAAGGEAGILDALAAGR